MCVNNVCSELCSNQLSSQIYDMHLTNTYNLLILFSVRYLGIGRYGGNALTDPRQPSFYKLSDSFDNLGSLSLSTHSSESTN